MSCSQCQGGGQNRIFKVGFVEALGFFCLWYSPDNEPYREALATTLLGLVVPVLKQIAADAQGEMPLCAFG